jgi:hypothetical protein
MIPRAKIYHHHNLGGSVWVVMSPDGDEFTQHSEKSPAEFYCFMRGWEWMVCE